MILLIYTGGCVTSFEDSRASKLINMLMDRLLNEFFIIIICFLFQQSRTN